MFSVANILAGMGHNAATIPTIYADTERIGYAPEPISVGAVEILSSNKAHLDCNGYKPTYKILTSYTDLIAPPTGKTIHEGNGELEGTLRLIKKVARISIPQVQKLAAHLQAETEEQSAFNVWHWMKTNLLYHYDKYGHEEVRTASRTFADRFGAGADCEDFMIFSSACLINMGYKPKARIVGFNNNENFGHIYTIL